MNVVDLDSFAIFDLENFLKKLKIIQDSNKIVFESFMGNFPNSVYHKNLRGEIEDLFKTQIWTTFGNEDEGHCLFIPRSIGPKLVSPIKEKIQKLADPKIVICFGYPRNLDLINFISVDVALKNPNLQSAFFELNEFLKERSKNRGISES